jgi:hypothetical protein
MPIRPVPASVSQQLPVVRFDLRRPIYLCPSNNLPGGPGARCERRQPKPAILLHVSKKTHRQALLEASVGTAVGGPNLAATFKVTDG